MAQKFQQTNDPTSRTGRSEPQTLMWTRQEPEDYVDDYAYNHQAIGWWILPACGLGLLCWISLFRWLLG